MIFYCDIDGVLADFESQKNALERYKKEQDFFKMLKPIKNNVEALKKIIKLGFKVKIISCSPHKKADHAKKIWLNRHLPEVKKKDMIFTRPEKPKIFYLTSRQRRKAILIDDFRNNITKWLHKGGLSAIKIKNGRERWDNKLPFENQLDDLEQLHEILKET